jgi:hypothetical protein
MSNKNPTIRNEASLGLVVDGEYDTNNSSHGPDSHGERKASFGIALKSGFRQRGQLLARPGGLVTARRLIYLLVRRAWPMLRPVGRLLRYG